MNRVFVVPVLLAASLTLSTAGQAGPGDAAARQQARLAAALAGLTPGEPRKCIDSDKVNQIKTFSGTILYQEGRGRIYRNDVTGGTCGGLARNDLVVTQSRMGRHCAGDRVLTRSRAGGQITGACALSEFVPYTRAGG